MIDWLVECWNQMIDGCIRWWSDHSIVRWFDRLIDWSIDRLIVPSNDWQIDRWMDSLMFSLTDELIDWLTNWLIDWSIDWLIDWLTNWLIHRKRSKPRWRRNSAWSGRLRWRRCRKTWKKSDAYKKNEIASKYNSNRNNSNKNVNRYVNHLHNQTIDHIHEFGDSSRISRLKIFGNVDLDHQNQHFDIFFDQKPGKKVFQVIHLQHFPND